MDLIKMEQPCHEIFFLFRLLAYFPCVHDAASSRGAGEFGGSFGVPDRSRTPPVAVGGVASGTLCGVR